MVIVRPQPDQEGVCLPQVREGAPAALRDAADRFVSWLVEGDVVDGLDKPCLDWGGQRNEDGYGRFKCSAFSPSPQLTHKVSFLLFVGVLAPGEQVHHKCGRPECCQPAHLEARARGPHLAEHNRARRGVTRVKRMIEISERQEVERDGRVFTLVNLDKRRSAPTPRTA